MTILRCSDAKLNFSPTGTPFEWISRGRLLTETAPIRQNTRCEFNGIQLWVRSCARREEVELLPVMEEVFTTELESAGEREAVFVRKGRDWSLEHSWELKEDEVLLRAKLTPDDPTRAYQVEILWWNPFTDGDRGWVEGLRDEGPYRYDLPKFGRVVTKAFSEPCRWVRADGVVAELEGAGFNHFYHRGFSLKIGGATPISVPGEALEFSIRFRATPPSLAVSAPVMPQVAKVSAPDLSRFSKEGRAYETALMLHLQYTASAKTLPRLERWLTLARQLGFDRLVLELGRGYRAHPLTPPEALPLEVFAGLAKRAKEEGISLTPCYNLLGHQFENGLLDWKPQWRETVFDGLCVSHPEVREFAARIVGDLLSAFDSSLILIGGDELKLPNDEKEAVCPLCGPSPNMDAIVGYWNFLQESLPAGKSVAIWGDQLIDVGAVDKLTAHGWHGRSLEYLSQLDQRVTLIDWQYSDQPPEPSQRLLSRRGHRLGLASGQYFQENPFLHAEWLRQHPGQLSIHTTWASPHPADCPLESVAAAALAHAGELFERERVERESREMAAWLYDRLSC